MLIALGKFIVDLLLCMYGDVDIGCSDSGSATLSLVVYTVHACKWMVEFKHMWLSKDDIHQRSALYLKNRCMRHQLTKNRPLARWR